VSLAAIYFRGYLIPYTPTLTKRYFPERVLRWFDKSPHSQESAMEMDEGGFEERESLDVERELVEKNLVTECENREDLCLSPWFGDAWNRRIREISGNGNGIDSESYLGYISEMLDVDEERLSIDAHDDSVVLYLDGRRAAFWESDAALLADVSAERALNDELDSWDDYDVVNRSQLLSSLRIFLEECPSCGSPISMDTETVESCCRSIDVLAVTCDNDDCRKRLFEQEYTEEMLSQ
ncbi:MAG: hypothetical protein SXQ77_01825, partial [Halobacteria archaeon]|nr:hypothetical protein [Halobacteria archaeon]